MEIEFSYFALCSVLCEEGLRSTSSLPEPQVISGGIILSLLVSAPAIWFAVIFGDIKTHLESVYSTEAVLSVISGVAALLLVLVLLGRHVHQEDDRAEVLVLHLAVSAFLSCVGLGLETTVTDPRFTVVAYLGQQVCTGHSFPATYGVPFVSDPLAPCSSPHHTAGAVARLRWPHALVAEAAASAAPPPCDQTTTKAVPYQRAGGLTPQHHTTSLNNMENLTPDDTDQHMQRHVVGSGAVGRPVICCGVVRGDITWGGVVCRGGGVWCGAVGWGEGCSVVRPFSAV